MPESAGVPEAREKVERLSRAGLRSKGQVRFPDEEAVLDLRSDRRRNPVAKAFVGSNPTPRTNDSGPLGELRFSFFAHLCVIATDFYGMLTMIVSTGAFFPFRELREAKY